MFGMGRPSLQHLSGHVSLHREHMLSYVKRETDKPCSDIVSFYPSEHSRYLLSEKNKEASLSSSLVSISKELYNNATVKTKCSQFIHFSHQYVKSYLRKNINNVPKYLIAMPDVIYRSISTISSAIESGQ